MRLTKREKDAFEFLRYFTNCYLTGETPNVNETDFNKLNEIGIKIKRVNHRKIAEIKKGKKLRMARYISNAPWYIRGLTTYEYLPFQVKRYKEIKKNA
jgi:hypothetical protein